EELEGFEARFRELRARGARATATEVRPLGEELHQYLLKRAENAKLVDVLQHMREQVRPVWTMAIVAPRRVQAIARDHLAILDARGAQHYQYVSQFPRWCATVYGECPDPDARDFLLENIIEEESGTKHVDLLIRFAEACGLSRAEVETARQLPTTRGLTAWCYEMSHRSFHIAAAALLVGLESQVPGIYRRNLPPLK